MKRSPSPSRAVKSAALPASPPVLFFSADALLCDERDVLSAVPETSDLESLRHAFLSRLHRNREDFFAFCASRNPSSGYRIYGLSPALGPFRAVFCEKTVLGGTPLTAVFPGESATAFYRFMAPSSDFCTNTVNRVLFELLYLKNGGSPAFSALSPEIFASVSRVPHLAEAIFSERCGTRLCDLAELFRTLLAHVGDHPSFGSVELIYGEKFARPRRDRLAGKILADLPVEAVVTSVTALLGVMRGVSADRRITVTVSDLGQAREVELLTAASLPFRTEDAGLSVLFRLPGDFEDAVRMAVVLTEITRIPVSVLSDGTSLRIRFLIGGEIPPLLDFKYSDPIAAVRPAADEILALF